MSAVDDCRRITTAWAVLQGSVLGETGVDVGTTWSSTPEGRLLLFPERLDPEVLRRATASGARQVGLWVDRRVDPAPALTAGFTKGWRPRWMVADVEAVGPADDPRVRLSEDGAAYRGSPDPGYEATVALARLRPRRAWYAEANVDGAFAGRAWSFLPEGDDVAGAFDMAVWERFRRRGIGTALLRRVVAEAAAAGARRVVLNATPEGALLYARNGFTDVGRDRTFWWHRTDPASDYRNAREPRT